MVIMKIFVYYLLFAPLITAGTNFDIFIDIYVYFNKKIWQRISQSMASWREVSYKALFLLSVESIFLREEFFVEKFLTNPIKCSQLTVNQLNHCMTLKLAS